MKKEFYEAGIYRLLKKFLLIMKLTLTILLFSLVNLTASTYSQTTRLDISLKNGSMIDLIKQIEGKSEFFFYYQKEDIKDLDEITIELNNATVMDILDMALKDSKFDYRIVDRYIVLRQMGDSFKEDFWATARELTSDQQRAVSGKVTTTSGEQLPGVTVLVKGTTQGTTTNVDGEYTLLNIPEDATLVFSFVGMRTQEVVVRNQVIINVSLEEETIGIEEVVAIGYGYRRKEDVTASISQVNSEELEAMPVLNMEQSLKGRSAGVLVQQNSGQPGAGVSIRIRGDNSIIGSNEPLYVLDGFPVTGSISHLNPNDIESISILKDASATAIYGSRGANGVVIITSKQGKRMQEGRVEVNSFYGIQQEVKRYHSLNAWQYATVANEWLKNEGHEPYWTESEIASLGEGTDWWGEFYNPAPVQSHTLTFSNGTGNTNYSFSLSYYEEEGIMINSKARRGNTRLNLNHDLNEWITFGVNLILGRRESNYIPVNNEAWHNAFLGAAPTLPLYDENGEILNPGIQYSWTLGNLLNPLVYTKPYKRKSLTNSIDGNIYIDLKITDDLTFTTRNGLEYHDNDGERYAPSFRQYNGTEGESGFISYDNSVSNSFLTENTLNYLKVLNERHRIDLLGGITYQTRIYRSFDVQGTKLASDITQNYDWGGASLIYQPSSGYSEWTLLSGLARVNYIFNHKYMVTGSFRADGSSRFGAQNKWGYFPSGALSWRLSEEPFMTNVDFLSNIKIRTSYGITGSTALSPYQTLNRLGTRIAVFGGNTSSIGYTPRNVSNPALKWEETAQFDVGIDFTALNRIDIVLDYYRKVTSDLLSSVPLPHSTGFSSVLKNVGKMENKGFELSVNSEIFRQEFKWDVTVQAATNKNTILELVEGADIVGGNFGHPFNAPLNIMREGEAYGSFYGLIEDGIGEDGFYKYKDLNGDEIVDTDDRVIIGDPNPDLIYSLNNNFSYKNFGLNIFLDGVQGRDIFWATSGTHLGSMQTGHNQLADFWGNYWTPENPDPNAKYQKVCSKAVHEVSDRYVKDGSYLRLRVISLSYNIPVRNISWLQNAQIYIRGTNLYTFTNYPGVDPEVNTRGNSIFRGVDEHAYPSSKMTTIGAKINF